MSAGARDLIPRMLKVDPMKRMTIPQIRQHPWFQARLARYLAVPPPDTMQQAKKVCVSLPFVLHERQAGQVMYLQSQRRNGPHLVHFVYFLSSTCKLAYIFLALLRTAAST